MPPPPGRPSPILDDDDGLPMRRDRDGSWILDETQQRHSCRQGWKGEGLDGRPIPCLTCKPHLARRRAGWAQR